MKIKSLILSVFFNLILFISHAQELKKYWIGIDEKQLLLTQDFNIDTLKIENKSLWLNAFTTKITENQLELIQKNPLVSRVLFSQEAAKDQVRMESNIKQLEQQALVLYSHFK